MAREQQTHRVLWCGVNEWNVLTAKWTREKPISIMSNTCPGSSNMVSISFILLRRFKQAQIFVNWNFYSSLYLSLQLFCSIPLFRTQSTYTCSHENTRAAISSMGICAQPLTNQTFSSFVFVWICTRRYKQPFQCQLIRDVQRWSWYEFVLMAIGDVASVLFLQIYIPLQTHSSDTHSFLSYTHSLTHDFRHS